MNTTLTGLFTLECVLKIFAFGFRVRKEKRAVSKGGIGGTFLVLVKVDYTSHTSHTSSYCPNLATCTTWIWLMKLA